MSDQTRDEDFGGLGSSFLEDALNGSAPSNYDDDEPRRSAPVAEPPRPEAPRAPTGGVRPAMERKRREIIDLEKRVETHRDTKIYEKKDANGGSYFDYLAMQEDQVRLQRLNREYNELKERDHELQAQNKTRADRVREMAQALLRREIPRLDTELRRPTAEMFAAILKRTMDAGTFNRADYSSRDVMQQALDQVFDAAYGSALRRSRLGAGIESDGAPGASGFDEHDDPKPKKSALDDEDDFTNNLMYAYNQKKRKSMTVAEAKRAAAEQEGKGATQ